MDKYIKKTRAGITPEKILAWVEMRAKKKRELIGAELGVSKRTISSWNGEVMDFIKQSPQYRAIAPRLAEMIPRAFDVYDRRLDEPSPMALGHPDLIAAKDVLKMAGVMVDRQEMMSVTHDATDEELEDQLVGLIIGTDTDNDPEPEGGGPKDSGGTEPAQN